MDMSKIGKNIKILRKRRKLSQGKLAELCGWDPVGTRISNYENTDREPSLEDIEAIAKALNVWPGSLAFDDFPAENEVQISQIKGLPILDTSEIFGWPNNKRHLISNKKLEYLPDKIVLTPNCYAAKIKDDSMFNYIKHEGFQKDRYIIINPEKKANTNDYVIAKVADYHDFLFRKLINNKGKLSLTVLNKMSDHDNIPFDSETIICGVVIAYLDILIKPLGDTV
jgi:SOS-response transcriptional repressor LexA